MITYEGEVRGAMRLQIKGNWPGLGRSHTVLPWKKQCLSQLSNRAVSAPVEWTSCLTDFRASGTAQLLTKDVPSKCHNKYVSVAQRLAWSYLPSFVLLDLKPEQQTGSARDAPHCSDNRSERLAGFASPE